MLRNMAKLSGRPRNKSQVGEVPKLISLAILKAHSHPSLSPAPQGQGLEYPIWRLIPMSKAGVSWTKTSHCLTIAPKVTKSMKIPEIVTSSAHYKAVYTTSHHFQRAPPTKFSLITHSTPENVKCIQLKIFLFVLSAYLHPVTHHRANGTSSEFLIPPKNLPRNL